MPHECPDPARNRAGAGFEPVAVITCADMPKPDSDGALLMQALGEPVELLSWDADADWSRFSRVVLRSPWDYHTRLPEFLAWARRVAARSRLLNPLPVIEWNSHKRYLFDLQRQGVAIVPTRFIERDEPAAAAALAAFGGAEVVVKPAVSIGAFGALRGAADSGAMADHLRALASEGDVLLQPFLPAIADGEVSLIFFGGRFSHAVRKVPQTGDFRCQDLYGGVALPHEPDADERALAEAALAAAPAGWVYARVDMLRLDARPVLIELELIEPSLFLDTAPGSADRLAAALRAAP